ncbi:hypothetical protein X559_0883 [Paenilisteria newyorkensis]|nr:hypothetical protein X559_0883 [Listeria newyorkensis]
MEYKRFRSICVKRDFTSYPIQNAKKSVSLFEMRAFKS